MKTANRRLLAARLALALAVLAGLALSNWASFERHARQAAFRARALGLAGSELALIERALRLGAPGRLPSAKDSGELAARIERGARELGSFSLAGLREEAATPTVREALSAVEAGAGRLAERVRAGDTGAGLATEAEALLRRTGAVQAVLEGENEAAVLELRRWSLVRLAATLALLLGLATFVLRPLWRAIRTEMQRLGRVLEQTLQSMADGVLIIDRGGAVLEANPAAVRLLGESRWDGSLEHWLQGSEVRKADGTEMLLTDLPSYRALQENRVVETEWRFRFPGASDWTWVLSRAGPVRGPMGQVEGAVSIMRDITQRRRLEEQLETQAVQLERSNAELQAFASIASHELQEPMRKVVAFGDRLKDRCFDRLPPEGREDLERIQRAAHRMVRLVETLLRYARVERDPPSFEPVPLGEALDEALLDLEARLEASSGEVRRGTLPEVWGDRSQLEQVFGNILSNALKFARPGVPPRVDVSSREAGEFWEILVSDNGIGFEPGYAGLLFEPFSRLHPRDRYEGTGMGLAITRRIIRRHGGEITAEGRPGEGATFVLRLPKRSPETSRKRASRDEREGPPEGGTR